MNQKKITINAVHESDLESFMKKFGLYDDYKSGKLKCICGKTITDENLTAFKPINGKPYALCSIICATDDRKPECSRCNGNGCPVCDGTKGSKYNPEPY